jgi:hypothetical protein
MPLKRRAVWIFKRRNQSQHRVWRKQRIPHWDIQIVLVEKKMRYPILAVVALMVGLTTSASAVEQQISSARSWDDCYRLAWVRGVHVEQGELPDWDAQCMAGKIPFESGMASDSIRSAQR